VGASALGLDYLLGRRPEPSHQETTATSLTTSSSSLTASSSSTVTTPSTTTSMPPGLVELSFYYDPDLDGILDPSDSELNLTIKVGGQGQTFLGNKVLAPSKAIVDLLIEGTSSVGKQLTTATYDEPRRPVALPNLRYQMTANNASIGLADGPATSPIKPSDVNIDDYDYYFHHPQEWKEQYSKYYPANLPYEPNYFFYGALEPGSYGVPEGKPHLAFDTWAADGKPVHACWGGKIVPGLYDWKFGVDCGRHTAYYNHLTPTVRVGDSVSRYDVVGHIEKGQGHVHFELRPDPTAILNIFTTMTTKDVLKSPLRGESVPILPYFGER